MLVLAALSAFAPLSSDMYLPAFPELARSLHASSSLVQMSLSLCFLGLAIGQIFAGAISDAVGRRRPLLLGLLAYTVASAVCAAAPSIVLLILMRFIQGLAGAFGIAIARAVIRDRASGIAATHAYATMMLVVGVAPIVAPLMGGILLHFTDWRGIFAVLAASGAIVFAVVIPKMPESLGREQRNTDGLAGVGAAFRILFGDHRYLRHITSTALACGTMIAYISGAPFVLERIHGMTPLEFSLVFAVNSGGLIGARRIAMGLIRRISPETLLLGTVSFQGAGALGVLASVVLGLGLLPLLASLFVAASMYGGVVPIATTLAMEDHPERAGSASGMLGFTQFTVAAAVGPIVGVGGPLDALPLAIVMPVCSLGAVLALQVSAPRAPAAPPAHGRSAGR
jgi:DHA1 family bicyclomycin/chloramphenicol resistance-like MFS transporter